MTEQQALIRAICLEPADDTARLVYADWLQDNGEENRAEFIRLSCELSRVSFEVDEFCMNCYGGGGVPVKDKESGKYRKMPCWNCHNKLCESCQSLFQDNASNWWKNLPGTSRGVIVSKSRLCSILGGNGWQWFINRGFVSRVKMPCSDLLGHAEIIFCLQPIDQVKLTDRRTKDNQRPPYHWAASIKRNDDTKPGQIGTNFLPWSVAKYLRGKVEITHQYLWTYRQMQEADDDLNQACVQYGRERAGLTAEMVA